MKKKINKHLFQHLCLVLLAGLMYCCTDDREHYEANNTADRSITFSVRIPIPSIPDTYALNTVQENEVATIDILLFDASDNYVDLHLQANSITTDPSDIAIKTFTVKVPEGTYNMVILANSRDILSTATLNSGDSKATVLNQLNVVNAGKWNATPGSTGYMPIPMWGETGSMVVGNTTPASNPVNLTRILAKINVEVDATIAANFKLSSVRLYNYNDQGKVVPLATNWDNTQSKVTAPSVIGTLTKGPLAYTTMTTPNVSCINEIYAFEAVAGAANTLPNNTCLVIGGIYAGDTQETFYRIDMANTSAATPVYLPLLRNHRYDVDINKISASGYATFGDAFAAKPVNIKAAITVFDESKITKVAYDGQYLLGVSNDDLSFTREARTATSLDNSLSITTDYPSGWKVSKYVDGSNNLITWLSLTPDNSSTTGTVATKLILTENTTGSPREGYIHLSAGRLTYVVKVTQSKDAALMLSIRDASNTADITELTFAAGVNIAPVAQQILLSWLPADKTLSASSSTMGSNPAFVYALSSNKPGAGENGYIDPSGSKTLSILPPMITAADLASDPFLDRISKVDFSVFNGSKTLFKSVYFRQIVPKLLVEPTGRLYSLDGSTYTLQVRSNTDWRIKSVAQSLTSGTGSLLNLKPTDNLKVGATGSSNTNPGTAVTFRVANGASMSGTVTVVFESSPTGLFSDVTHVIVLGEFYPPKHKGWAGSNIYWDTVNKRLTFDGVGVTTHEQYQGLYFQWGSLWGMSPYSDAANKEDFTGTTILYGPTPASGTATSFSYGTWDTSPSVKDATTITSNPPAGTGKTERDRAYLYEFTDVDGTNGIGDICRYMTLKGWAPGFPTTKWRMPTSQEFETAASYKAWTGGTTVPTSISTTGTTKFAMGRRRTDTGTPFFPASGTRFVNGGGLFNVGGTGNYWSGSPSSTTAYNLILSNGLVYTFGNALRSNGFSIRCVKE